MNEITFKLPDDAMRRVVKLNEKEYELKEAMMLNQKTMLQRACEEQPDRKGEFMWEIEKLCCRIGNVLVLKNQGVLIDRASISDKEQK